MDKWRLPLTCLCLLAPALALMVVAVAVEAAPPVVKAPAAAARHYVLVHGSGHGAWCWYKVHNLLRRAGQKVTALDLTSAGISPIDPNTVLTFPYYNKPLIDFLASLPPNEKVVLVGHSAGGLSLTHAIHMFGPKKISAAVYAGAVMLRSGFITREDLAIGFPNISEAVRLGFGQAPDRSIMMTSFAFLPKYLRKVLYNRSPEEDIVLASALLKPAPGHAMLAARFNSTGVDVDGVPRVYVKTMMDRVFKQEVQDAMIKKWPPHKVVALNSDHCLFFSAPREFAQVLLKV
ncbi:Methylesterase 17 [Nymphaea thermarum]|nr:Methylesterase 17 [Nymphaea thermarum]